MLENLQARLTELEGEFHKGEGRLQALVQEETTLRETLLRISGAIEVLRELTSAAPETADRPTVEPKAEVVDER